MPDLPIPEDAAEAALFSECWDAVFSYADLCTAGSAAASRLAAQAFARGTREARGTGRPARLPRVPLLLTAVRATAASWEAAGRGQELDPGLRLWLHSPEAARHTGPPPRRPLALRALRELRAPDAELLWLADVEALPLTGVARRLGLDPATAADRLDRARARFRDRCRRARLDGPCRDHAALLDAVTGSPGADLPEDLSRHLATCADCAEAAACLRPHGTAPAAALAAGVLGWGGPAYLERRRRAADARLGAAPPGPADADEERPVPGGHRARMRRGGLLLAAAAVSLLALGVSLMPLGSSSGTAAPAPAGGAGRRTAADPVPAPPPPSVTARARPSAAGTTGTPGAGPGRHPSGPGPEPEPRATATATPVTDPDPEPEPAPTASPDCRVRYDLVDQWPDGFQAAVTVTTGRALDDWRVTWTFPDGQRVTRMWDATATQDGPRVTADAADYNRALPAGGSVGFGFLASWRDGNSPPGDITLNGRACAAD
ncbi:cellulose-binding domain-containing protein [Streptomyces sp. NPDC005876]|uniref:cellulose-binding domain-containing protein n=1 Tax=Streptomyces sp. NPDC005876 TaxID=3157076 RepID=UPI0033FF31FB